MMLIPMVMVMGMVMVVMGATVTVTVIVMGMVTDKFLPTCWVCKDLVPWYEKLSVYSKFHHICSSN